MKPRTRLPFATAVLVSVLTAASCGATSATLSAPEPPPVTQPPVAQAGSVRALLAEIPVKGRAPKTGYDRDEFGSGWGDPDRNGCDTRNDILARDLVEETFRPGTNDCVVLTGMLMDPYTGDTIHFTRGQDTSGEVQIDHVVALSNAWQTGAQQLSEQAREEFANDPLNLQATDGPTNGAKGDGDAATWLPPHRPTWCAYVATQVEVKARYGLWMTEAEHTRIGEILEGCPDEATGAVGGIRLR